MALTYQLITQNTEPLTYQEGDIWVKPDTCQVFIRTNDWLVFASGANSIASFVEGRSSMDIFKGDEAPTAVVGQIWINNVTKQVMIYLDDWCPFVGGV